MEVFPGKVKTHWTHADLVCKRLRNSVAESHILQTAVADVLKITVARHSQLTVGTKTDITSRTRQIGIRVVLTPYHLMEVTRNERGVRTCVRTIEQDIVGGRSPIHLADSLEEDSKVESKVLEAKVQAIVVARLVVADNRAVARIINRVLALVHNAVTVQIQKLHISSMESTLVTGSRDDGLVDKCLVNLIGSGFCVRREQSISVVTPDFTYTHTYIVGFGERALAIVKLGDFREVITEAGCG